MKRKRKKGFGGGAEHGAAWTSELEPAPGDLRIVQAFLNTVDLGKGTDELASPRALGEWLARWGLASARAEYTQADVERAREVREALRILVRANSGAAVADNVVALLDRAAAKTPLVVRFHTGGTRHEPDSGGLDGALGRLFHLVARAEIEGLWPRFKVCASAVCRRAFYDKSPNRSAKWCCKLCGNRIISRASRQRRRRYFAAQRKERYSPRAERAKERATRERAKDREREGGDSAGVGRHPLDPDSS